MHIRDKHERGAEGRRNLADKEKSIMWYLRMRKVSRNKTTDYARRSKTREFAVCEPAVTLVREKATT